MATRNNAAWLVLAAALAVPGFMFFYWWTNLNTQSRSDLQRRVRRRLGGSQVFGAAPAQEKLRNPMSPAASPAAAPAAAPVAVSSGAAGLTPRPGGLVASAAAQPAPSVAAHPAAAPATSAPSAAPAASAEKPDAALSVLQTGPIGQIVLARDPLLSPYDLVRIAQEEERKRQIEEELKKAAWLRAHPPKRPKYVPQEVDPNTLVELQGIVSNDEGDKAIVNGEMVQEGDTIAGVKVLKISPTAVVFQYRKKRFMKGISKD